MINCFSLLLNIFFYQTVWLNEFQTFDDKSSAINVDTGVDEKLTMMIMKWHRPKKKLLVGKPEYKSVRGINCLHNELVMEVMWGMKHLMHKLVPGEKSQLSMEDHLPMSQGLQILLRRYGFDVEPEMVNEQIVATARVLFKCDDVEKKEYQNLCLIRHYLKKVSGIDYESWDPLKLATAFKIIISRSVVGDSDKMFPEDVISKLLSDADKYDAKINKVACLRAYSQLASAHRVRAFKRNELDRLVKKAKKVYQS
ncbi:uncharacterized protein [Miscanthus floridulus]|uniref:uncharacterized protein isoform X2 n=1 Tax=Miscanthus floridulus TaxID=154761 RepID=UPI00345B2730